jgi:predicted outer membrane repeat protein
MQKTSELMEKLEVIGVVNGTAIVEKNRSSSGGGINTSRTVNMEYS